MKTSPLANLQQQFLRHLRGKGNSAISSDVSCSRMPAGIGLRIYVHAYGARLHEALEQDHPILGAYLGDTLWEKMCRGYVLSYPSKYRSLRDFGTDLPAYLAEAKAFRRNPEIAELALFERRLLDTFDAADDRRADWDQLLQLPEAAWPALVLRFHPSLRFHLTVCNSVEIWRAIKNGQTPPPVGSASASWVLWRDDDRVNRFRSLNPAESTAVKHCVLGGDIAGMCSQLLAWHSAEALPAVALGYVSTWFAEGWISSWE